MKSNGEVMLINDDARQFQLDVNTNYVDKTQLISFTNSKIPTNDHFICVSRPRRFGKSMAVHALVAYYSKGANSKELFTGLKISQDPTFNEYLNQFNTLFIDMHGFFDDRTGAHFFEDLNKHVISKLSTAFPSVFENNNFTSIKEALRAIYQAGFGKFVVVIDEWDMLLRECGDNENLTKDYINLLRSLFKDSDFSYIFALVYMTGILPIKRYKTQSALNNFDEYTMLDPGEIEDTFGFTEDEVKEICSKSKIDFEQAKMWYDGYHFEQFDIYNPYAIANLVKHKKFKSYWSKSSTTEPVIDCLNCNFDGLRDEIMQLVSGCKLTKEIDIDQTKIIPDEFAELDDVLVYLVHLGYLSFNQDSQTVSIPNQEIRSEFAKALKACNWEEYTEVLATSDKLLDATRAKDAPKVAKLIEEYHQNCTSLKEYNDESALKYTVLMAYFSSIKYYSKPLIEQPTGKGIADLILTPRRAFIDKYPALVIELKCGHTAQDAITQIKEKNYVEFVKTYAQRALLIGISYDPKTKAHSCVIEEERFDVTDP